MNNTILKEKNLTFMASPDLTPLLVPATIASPFQGGIHPSQKLLIGRNGGPEPTPGKSPCVFLQPHDYIKHSIKSKIKEFTEFKALYESGLSLREIAKRTGQSRTKVLMELRKAGVAIRDFSRGSKQKHDRTQVMKSGTTPFGFTYLEGKLVVEPSEYRIVLEMIRHWRSGQSLRAIARILNDRGVATRFGKKWKHEVIKHIIERFEKQVAKEK